MPAPPSVRPLFLPADVDFEALPEPLQLATSELIVPAYCELVLQAPNAMLRSAGLSFVFVMFLELVDQFELAAELSAALGQGTADRSAREAAVKRYLRLATAKERAGSFLLRVRAFRAKFEEPADVTIDGSAGDG